MALEIIDTHAHLDDPAFANDLDQVLAESRAAGVRAVINIAYCPRSWEASRRLRDAYPGIWLAIGLHPQDASLFTDSLHRDLIAAVVSLRPVAIGETGFDFFRKGPTQAEQERAFRAQLELATDTGLPIVIHQRSAAAELMSELDRWHSLPPIVLHSFDGDQRLMAWARERDCYVGVGGLATRPGSTELRKTLEAASVDRLLLETDAPYLAPFGSPSRRNSPANLPLTATALASVWSISPETLIEVTTANARRLFGLQPSVPSVPMANECQGLPDADHVRAALADHSDPPRSGASYYS